MSKIFHLFKSPRQDKKYVIIAPGGIRIDFGAKGYSDFTKHKNPTRKNNYIRRHVLLEDHSPNGMFTAGFWARWLLWNKETITDSIKDIEKNFAIKIIYHKYSG
jgi:hypothetical protein